MILDRKKVDLFIEKYKELHGETTYSTWLIKAEFYSTRIEDEIVLGAATPFIIDYIKDELKSEVEEVAKLAFKKELTLVKYDKRMKATLVKEDYERQIKKETEEDKQLEFFVPAIVDPSVKDDVHLMEITPFRLSYKDHRDTLIYDQINGMNVKIEANPMYGLPFANDYDICLFVSSHLAEERNRYKGFKKAWILRGKTGKEPTPPPRHVVFDSVDIRKFSKSGKGGQQAKDFAARLDRLAGTRVKITEIEGKKKRDGSFPLIGGYQVLSHTDSGEVQQVKLEIPLWVYDGIMRDKPTILTYNTAYLSLEKPLIKAVYRIVRIEARKGACQLDCRELHTRIGTKSEFKYFVRDLKAALKDFDTAKEGKYRFPDYELTIGGTKRIPHLTCVYRGK